MAIRIFSVNTMKLNIKPHENDVNTIPNYAPDTGERQALFKELEKIHKDPVEIPLIINGKEVKTDDIYEIKCPHNKDLTLAKAHFAGEDEINEAIESALQARLEWAELDWHHRLAIFTKAANMLAGIKRTRNIAIIMMNHSKNPYEAEIDLVELVDFWNI
jgi:1-pyrroline-5-carboxylate dehydrogenase